MFQRLGRVAALLADPRTPKLPRLAVLLAVLYALWPADALPGAIFPIVGYLDDLVLIWLSLRWLLKRSPPEGERPTIGDRAGPSPP